MVDQVQIPHSVVADKKPLQSQLVEGGLAVNLTDYRLYTKGYDGAVIRLSGRVEIVDDGGTAGAVFLTWVKGAAGNIPIYTSSAKLSFNPSTGALSAVSFVGDGSSLTGMFRPAGTALAPPATDLASVIALANSIRSALVSCGIGS